MSEKRNVLSGLPQAQAWANALVMREMKTPGDLINSMHRLERRYGISWRIFFNLRYRPPSDVLVGVYRQLHAAYQNECERQEKLLAHERHVAEAKVLAAETLLGPTVEPDQQEND